MRTGITSTKPKDVNFHDAALDPETRTIFIHSELEIYLEHLFMFTDLAFRPSEATRLDKRLPYCDHCFRPEDALQHAVPCS